MLGLKIYQGKKKIAIIAYVFTQFSNYGKKVFHIIVYQSDQISDEVN